MKLIAITPEITLSHESEYIEMILEELVGFDCCQTLDDILKNKITIQGNPKHRPEDISEKYVPEEQGKTPLVTNVFSIFSFERVACRLQFWHHYNANSKLYF